MLGSLPGANDHVTEPPIRVLLVDDYASIRNAISLVFTMFSDILLVAAVGNGLEAIALCEESLPDVILMDIDMPIMNGIEATGIIHQRWPGVTIIPFSSLGDEEMIQAMTDAGAMDLVRKDGSIQELVDIIRRYGRGAGGNAVK